MNPPSFTVVPGAAVYQVIWNDVVECTDVVRRAYTDHEKGRTINPHSYFLRFPKHPSRRIIALPAQVDGDFQVAGIKWIASYPENIGHGLPRASAVLILNDSETGYPIACLEGSIISAARTAASAALGAEALLGRRSASSLGIVGTGLIARYVYAFLLQLGWQFGEVRLYDRSPEEATRFAGRVASFQGAAPVVQDERIETTLERSELLVFATTAGKPYVDDPRLFSHGPAVLHLSLRDLSPQIILGAFNLVDDADHVVNAGTSLHLAEQVVGHREFIHGSLGALWSGGISVDKSRVRIFSPFGLGMLDLAVGKWVLDRVRKAGESFEVPQFFFELSR